MPSHRKMIVALLLGAGLGIAANVGAAGSPWLDAVVRNVAQPLGQLFIRLLFMLVVPLLFSALVLGIADLEVRHLGRLGARRYRWSHRSPWARYWRVCGSTTYGWCGSEASSWAKCWR